MNKACEDIRARLEAFHDGELPAKERDQVAAHVEACPGCARELESLGALSTAVRGALSAMPRPVRLTGMETRVRAELESAGAAPRRGFSWRGLGWGGKLGTVGSLAFAAVLCLMVVWNVGTNAPDVPSPTVNMPTVSGPEKVESDGSLLITQSPESGVEVITVFNVQA